MTVRREWATWLRRINLLRAGYGVLSITGLKRRATVGTYQRYFLQEKVHVGVVFASRLFEKYSSATEEVGHVASWDSWMESRMARARERVQYDREYEQCYERP
jgi:hypothetical protein